MEKFIMKRGTGKSYQLIKRSAQSGEYIVCHNMEEAHRLQVEARDMGVTIPLPITYKEFISGMYYHKGIKGFLVDNVELLISSMSHVPITAITLTP